MDESAPYCSVIIVNYNTCSLLRKCLESICNSKKCLKLEIIVVDNNSSDDSLKMLSNEFPHVIVSSQENNLGFTRANNAGVKKATAPFILLLNSDTILSENCLNQMLNILKNDSQVAVIGPMIHLINGKPQEKTFGELPTLKTVVMQSLFLNKIMKNRPFFRGIYSENQPEGCCKVGWISGVCMLIRKDIYMEVGGFDEDFFMYAEDIDLCYRIKKRGWNIYRNNSVLMKHVRGGSTKNNNDRKNYSLMQQRNYMILLKKNLQPLNYCLCYIINTVGLILRLCFKCVHGINGKKTEKDQINVALLCLMDALGLLRRNQC